MRAMILTAVLAAACCIGVALGETNILRNPGFENSLEDEAWKAGGSKIERYSDDKTEGQYSLRVYNRKKDTSGINQDLFGVKSGRGYELRADVKLLTKNESKLFQNYKAIMQFHYLNYKDKDKPPSCKHLKGSQRKECLARRKKRKEKKKREEKQRKRQERKRKKRERRRKKKEQKKKRRKKKGYKKKKGKKEKRKERRKPKRGKEKQRHRGAKPRNKDPNKAADSKQGQENQGRGKKSIRSKPNKNLDSVPFNVTDHVTAADDIRRRLSRQRRQQRRRRVEPPMAERKHREPQALEDDESASGIENINKYIIAWRAWITVEQGWTTLVGSINAPMLDFYNTSLRIRGPDAGCDFLIDNVSLIEVPERTNWLEESLVNIDKYRKTDVTIKPNIPEGVPSADIDIQVRLKKHLFAFGSKVEYQVLTESQHQNFRDLFFNLFNWATIGSFKWRFDEGTLYEPDFSKAMQMLKVVEEQGLKVRAHSILWGVKDNIPDAVLSTDPSELPALLTHHTQYMMNLTKGRVAQWDVQNELLHGHWYEETMKDPNISIKVFKEARKWDSVPKLYLNDFTAVTSGANTEDLHDTALRFIKEGSGIQGIGIQGHTKEFVKPDPTMMWRRLDRLADTGLDLFMTEYDLGWDDDEVRADWFEDSMRAFFAHKDLKGVILWGFWKDTMRYKNKYLIYGEDFTFAEPGNRFACLLKKEWTTDVTNNMGSGSEFTLRGFQGDYEILVKRRGTVVQKRTFTLGENSKTITFDVTDRTNAIEVTEERDYVPECISHRDQKSLGNVASTAARSRLACEDVTAELASPATAATRLNVTCSGKKILTGCNSYQRDRKSKMWRGEEISFVDGVATCSAIVPQGGEGLKVSARCCVQTGLTCDYRRAGQSLFMKGAMAEAKCPSGYSATGCSVCSDHTHISGAFPSSGQDACRAKNGLSTSDNPKDQSGVVSTAACCRTGSLSCSAVRSEASASGASHVWVTCPENRVMTGCNVEVSSGGSAGSNLANNSGIPTCWAYTATDHPDGGGSVVAVAICCSKQ